MWPAACEKEKPERDRRLVRANLRVFTHRDTDLTKWTSGVDSATDGATTVDFRLAVNIKVADALRVTPIHVFWSEPTGMVRRTFRCYEQHADQDPASKNYCNAHRPKDEVPEGEREDGDAELYTVDLFPTHCESCGRAFSSPTRQIFSDSLYVIKTGPRAGEVFADSDRPVGAMWDGKWLAADDGSDRGYTGPDGISLFIQLPDGPFYTDSQCSNCTMNQYVPVEGGEPGARRFVRSHYCWQREGDPRTGYVNVGKIDPTKTCAAGAGSIWQNMPNGFHGFVYRGYVCEPNDFPEVNRLIDGGAPAPAVIAPLVVRRSPAPVRAAVPAPQQHRWRANRGFQIRPRR